MFSHLFLFRFFIWRGFKNKSDVCRVLCEELFVFDVTHSQIDVETEFGVVSLNLMFFFNFSFDKITFSILQISRARKRLLTLTYCKKGHCFENNDSLTQG